MDLLRTQSAPICLPIGLAGERLRMFPGPQVA